MSETSAGLANALRNLWQRIRTWFVPANVATVPQEPSSDPLVNAQHEETGYIWTGPRSQIPPRYNEVQRTSEQNYTPFCSECMAYSEPHEPTCSKYVRTSNQPCARCESYAEQLVALALEAEQLDKRLKAVRNRFDPLNESSLFSVAERDLNAELHEGSTRWQHSGHQISATLWSACATRQTGDAPPIRHR
jgi:hypothetical protein